MLRIAMLIAFCSVTLWTAAQPARVEKLLASGAVHENEGRADQAERDYEAAHAEAVRIGDAHLTGAALVALGYLQYTRGEMTEALETLRRAYDLGRSKGDAAVTNGALGSIAHVYADSRVAQYDRAIEHYEELLKGQTAAGDAEGVADSLFNLASTLERKGDLEVSLATYRRALDAESKLGRAEEVAYVKRSIGVVLSKLNRPSEALPLFGEALAFFEREGLADRAMMVRQSRGVARNRMEQFDAAIDDLEPTREYFEKNNNPRFLEKTEEELAKAYAGASRWPEAFRAKSNQQALAQKMAEKLGDEQSTRLRVQFDSERKEQQNNALAAENAANLRVRTLQASLLGGAVIVLAIVGALAFRLRSANVRLRDAQEKIARFNENAGEALHDVRAWSRGTAAELAKTIQARDIVVYSVDVALSGQESGFAALWDVISSTIQPPSTHRPSLSPRIDQAILSALAKDPAARPRAEDWAAELATALSEVKDGEPGWPHPLPTKKPERFAEVIEPTLARP